MADENEKEEGSFWDKTKKFVVDKVKNSYPYVIKEVWDDLNEGNELKKDLEQAKITGKSEHHADNYAHILTDAKIAQKGEKHARVALAIGVLKEGYDITKKVVFEGQNAQEVIADCKKDMKNNMIGLAWGLSHPNGNAEEWMASLDLEKNTFVEGYDNGILKKQLALNEKANLKASLKQEGLTAQNELKAKAAVKRVPDKVLGRKKPENEVPSSIKRPEEEKVVLPTPVWQKNKSNSR
ncbi:MAG: hypothetical protein J6B00_00440 [Alphaproteobacteria bacterium]|nr:hypothetical protein [Alphaproteobacteria bacterium]MBP3687357.1 hypothetical protein [Alphaproteobacteria bacterium]